MRQTVGTTSGPRIAHRVYDEPPALAAEWFRVGYAEPTTTPPREILQLLHRLDDGAGRPWWSAASTGISRSPASIRTPELPCVTRSGACMRRVTGT